MVLLDTGTPGTSNTMRIQWGDTNLQPLGYKLSALAIEINSSEAIAGKELSLFSLCIASLFIYHFSTVVDFSSEEYSGSTGHKNSWYSREIYSDDADGETRTCYPSVINRVL